MPKSLRWILDHADELADRFEAFDPELASEVPVHEHLLERAALARAQCERDIVEAVKDARANGTSWLRIGEILGTSAQAAQQRYGAIVRAD